MADLKLLRSFPPDKPISDKDYDEGIKQYNQSLEKIPGKQWTADAGGPSDLLNVLDPSKHSLAYLHTLLAHIIPYDTPKTNTQPPPQLCPSGAIWNKICLFTSSFDTVQIRYVPKELVRLLRYVYRLSSALQMAQFAIQPLRDAILQLDPDGGMLTTNHLTVLRAIMSMRAYTEAIPLLDKVIHTFPTKSGGKLDAQYLCSRQASASAFITVDSTLTNEITAHEVQEYFLLGGMCYTALRQWEDAQMYFEHVLVIPSGGVATGMMVEAYRKWLLVGSLAHGHVPKPPKLIGQNTLKDLKNLAKPWEAVAEIFQQGDPGRLAAEIDVGAHDWWSNNGDTGLVNELLIQLQRFFVVKLEKTYSAVPVATVAQWLKQSPQDANQYLLNLISAGQLNATIQDDTSGAILRFEADPFKSKSEEQQLGELQAQTAKTNLLAEYVRDADRKLAITKEYILDLLRKEAQKKQGASNGSGDGNQSTMPGGFGGEEMDLGYGGGDGDDEDLMGDV